MASFKEIVDSETPVLVDFFAQWCGPCKAMQPILRELKEKMGERYRILKVDVDLPANAQIVRSFNVSSVPTLMVFKAGRMVWRQSGVVGAQQLMDVLKKS